MIDLPRKDKEGKSVISYSQIAGWGSDRAFSSPLSGRQDYILKYFLGIKEEGNTSFAEFGREVENFITQREDAHKFTEEERERLSKIEPLGVFQKEVKIEFGDFYLTGFIDDCAPDFSKVRDYKTASEKSKEKYYLEDYYQLDIYAMGIQAETGIIPALEVCAIERLGNGFKCYRECLTVGERIWYIERKTDEARLTIIRDYIIKTAQEISDCYQVFKKINVK